MNINNLIFPYDYIILIILLLILIICFLKGFIQSILGLLTWIGSILITIYTYTAFAQFITNRILNINFFQNYEYLTNLGSIIISIPIIFLLSLFVLRRVRGFLSSDLDKEIFGKILDKLFGLFYGLIFFYAILSTLLIFINKFDYNPLNIWLKNNSYIILNIDKFNNKIIGVEEKINEIEQ